MSIESITQFNQAVAASPELRAKLESIAANSAEEISSEIAALATAAGYPISPGEVLAAAAPQEELSEEQLDQVAGGIGGLATVFLSAVSPGSCGYSGPPKL